MLERKLFFQDLPVFQTFPQPHDFTKADRSNIDFFSLENTLFSTLNVYIPFCERLCSFCGLNTTISRDHSWETRYLDLLKLELTQKKIECKQLHELKTILLTGGTPHFIAPEKLMGFLYEIDALKAGPNTILEVDPRVMSEAQLLKWISLGVTEIQFGVQDLSVDVQDHIGRRQDAEKFIGLIEICKQNSVRWGMDFILGLPAQNLANVTLNFDFFKRYSPHRVQIFNFRKAPWMTASQSLLDHSLTPNAELVFNMANEWSLFLRGLSYSEIGFGTWAKDNTLVEALSNGSIGFGPCYWTPHSQTRILGLGVSSFTQTSSIIFQNEKTLPLYERELQRGQSVVQRFHNFDELDNRLLELRRKIINNQEWLPAEAFCLDQGVAQSLDLRVDPNDIADDLSFLTQAGWLIEQDSKYRVSDRRALGLLFAIFDPYIRNRHPRFLRSRLQGFT